MLSRSLSIRCVRSTHKFTAQCATSALVATKCFAAGTSGNASTASKAPTSTLKYYAGIAREGLRHVYHGFRLFFINTRLAWHYSRQLKNGVALTRRERLLLESSTKDLLRLVPFSFFIIVPFAELLLPVALKMFPGLIPSTFETESQGRNRAFGDAMKTLLARQRIIEYISLTALATFNAKEQEVIKRSVMGDCITARDIRLLAPHFSPEGPFSVFKIPDTVALSLGRIVGVYKWYYAFMPTALVAPITRRQVLRRYHVMREDDRLLRVEGLDNLTVQELIKANQSRGMRWTESAETLRVQLEWWSSLARDPSVPYNTLFWLKPTYQSLRKSLNTLPVSQRRQLLGIQNLPEVARSSLEALCDTVHVVSKIESEHNTADVLARKIEDITDSERKGDIDIELLGIQASVGDYLTEENVRKMFEKITANSLPGEPVTVSDVIEYIGHETHFSSHVVSILFDAFDYDAGSKAITEAALVAIGARCRAVSAKTKTTVDKALPLPSSSSTTIARKTSGSNSPPSASDSEKSTSSQAHNEK